MVLGSRSWPWNFPAAIMLLVIYSFRCDSSDAEESACKAGDPSSFHWLGRYPRKRMATHSIILAWRIPWTEELGGLYIITGSQRVGHDRATNIFTFLMCFGEFLITDKQRWMKFIDLLYIHVRQGSKDIILTETEQLLNSALMGWCICPRFTLNISRLSSSLFSILLPC